MAKDLAKHLDGAKGAILITIGDTDADGRVGVRAHVFADVPFDGSDVPVGLLSSPEYEPADAGTLLGTMRQATQWATGALQALPFVSSVDTARRSAARRSSSQPVKPKRTRKRKVKTEAEAAPE